MHAGTSAARALMLDVFPVPGGPVRMRCGMLPVAG